jgi:hypothetical protein
MADAIRRIFGSRLVSKSAKSLQGEIRIEFFNEVEITFLNQTRRRLAAI